MGPQRLLDVVRPVHQRRVGVEALDPHQSLRLLNTALAEQTLLLLELDLEVLVFLQLSRDAIALQVLLDFPLLGDARDDQRGPRLVDQDRVDLIDDREVELLLDLLRSVPLHVVAQVVEAEFVVRAVEDVAGVLRMPLARRHARLDRAYGQSEVLVDRRHPVPVALGEVVVHGDEVGALALERVEREGEGRDEGLALTGHHLRDVAVVQVCSTDDLHVEVPLPQRAHRGLACHRKHLRERIVQGRRAGLHLLAPLGDPGLGLLLGKPLRPPLQLVDLLDDRLVAGEHPLVGRTEQLLQPLPDLGRDRAKIHHRNYSVSSPQARESVFAPTAHARPPTRGRFGWGPDRTI